MRTCKDCLFSEERQHWGEQNSVLYCTFKLPASLEEGIRAYMTEVIPSPGRSQTDNNIRYESLCSDVEVSPQDRCSLAEL